MTTYRIEFASPKLIARDGFKWTTHHSVTHRLAKTALSAARGDAKELRTYHTQVRYVREV